MIDTNISVFTVKEISERKREILYVVHDTDDEWQFLPGGDVSPDDIMIVSLQNILNIDETILKVINLPSGFEANRSDMNSEWTFQKMVD